MGVLLDFVLPHLCPGCQTNMHTPGFCCSCWMKLRFITNPYCPLCGNPGGSTLCHGCRTDTPLFHKHRSLWEYGPVSRRIIFALKHGRQRHLAKLLAHWVLPLVLEHVVDCIIPVPLHQDRLRQRGFNQCGLLVQEIGKLCGIPVDFHSLMRPLGAPSQGRFSPQQRQDNVMGAFSAHSEVENKRVLVIDDVFTTGATLNACAVALQQAGVFSVHAVTIAKVSR
jgi:ComF family protein